MFMRRFLFGLAVALCATGAQAQRADQAVRAAWSVAEVLLAADLAGVCRSVVHTENHKGANALLADAVVLFINERDLTMADFAAASQIYGPAEINRIKRQLLRRDGVDVASARARCFYARRIAGEEHPVGRFLVRR